MRFQLTILTLLTAATLAGCGGTSDAEKAKASEPEIMKVSGELRLMDGATNEVYGASGYEETDNCMGDGGYSDINAGAQVTVYNAAGEALGLGSLENGIMVSDDYVVHVSFRSPSRTCLQMALSSPLRCHTEAR